MTQFNESKYTPLNFEKIYDKIEVQYVVDGDTIDVLIDLGFDIFTKQRVRLFGIDTPESRTSDPEEKKYGLIAKSKIAFFCSSSKELQLRCSGDQIDKYGRVIAEIWIYDVENSEWKNINKWMCDNYYAVPYIGQNKKDVKDHHLYNRSKVDEKESEQIP